MKLAIISTINSLNKISSLGNIEFCLAPYCIKYSKYKQYFIGAKKKGRYVIMDNGIAEDILISDDELVKLAIEMQVSELIIPDIIGDYKKTRKKYKIFLKKYYNILFNHHIKLQGVVQGKNIVEYWTSFNDINNNSQINVIGVPFRIFYAQFNDIKTTENNRMLNRILFIESILYKTSKSIHILGCNSIKEMLILNQANIRSMDSKLITRYALNNKKININDNYKPYKKLYVDDNLTEKQIYLGIKNINEVKKWMNKKYKMQ